LWLQRKVAIANDRKGRGAKYLAILDSLSLRVPVKSKHTEAAYQLFVTPGLRWRIIAICMLWFSNGFSLYGLTLGVNSLSGDRYFNAAIMACAELPARLSLYQVINSRLGRKYGLLLWFSILAGCSITAMFWTSDIGRTTLNVLGRAASAAGFVTVYICQYTTNPLTSLWFPGL